jgi:hypothetical protein
MKKELIVKDVTINFFSQKEEDFISITDIAKYKNLDSPADVIKNWLRTKNTIEFLGFWEKINNPDFKLVEFDQFWQNAGGNAFVLSPHKWITSTNAIGIISKSGKNGGTFAHKDIAFEFASWVSAEFKLYIIKEFQRLKEEENERLFLGWDAKRTLTKINYKIHTDAIKEHIIPHIVTQKELSFIYANEADVLNVALFGMTAKQWRDKNPSKSGNIRDDADVSQLVCLANLESMNAELIRQNISQSNRLKQLNQIAIIQMKSLTKSKSIKKLDKSQ